MTIICIILGALSAVGALTMYACCVVAGRADDAMENRIGWDERGDRRP